MYRDASNYKEFHTIVVAGSLSEDQVKPLLSDECDGMGFIPSQVGMEDLQPRMTSYPSADDHVWHTICDETFKPTSAKPTVKFTAADLLKKLKDVNGNWDVSAACKKHGFDL